VKWVLPWESFRKRGLPYFVLVHGLLYWATGTFLLAALVLFFSPLWPEVKGFVIRDWPFVLLVWFWCGTGYAVTLWFTNQWRYRHRDSNK
jgi:hypothetical protein